MRAVETSIEKARRVFVNLRAVRALAGASGLVGILLSLSLLVSLPFGVFTDRFPMTGALAAAWVAALILAPVVTYLSMLTPFFHKLLLGAIALFFGLTVALLVPAMLFLHVAVRLQMGAQPGFLGFEPGVIAALAAFSLPYFIIALFLCRLGWSMFTTPRHAFAAGRGSSPSPLRVFDMVGYAAGAPLYARQSDYGWGVAARLLAALALSIAPGYGFFQSGQALSILFGRTLAACDAGPPVPLSFDTILFSPLLPALPCLDVSLDWVVLSALALAIVIAFLFVFGRMGARALTASARRQMTRGYDRARAADPRPPILFLRAFADDHRILSRDPGSLLDRITGMVGEPRNQDEIVLDTATPYGPVVAIGDPDDPIPPFGAARAYAGDRDWKALVSDIMGEATAVILSMDESAGLAWEIDEVLGGGFAGKTLFLFGPDLDEGTRIEGAMMLARGVGDAGYAPDLEPGRFIVGAYASDAGQLNVLTAKRIGAPAYIAACRWFLMDKFGHPNGLWKAPRLGRPFPVGD